MDKQLYIRTFGKFRFFVDGEAVEESFCRSQKAQEIFRYLLAFKGRKISKDTLCDMFWPGMEFSKARQNLSSTLYFIRNGLDNFVSEKGFGKKVVRSSTQMCWLEFPPNVHCDADEFRQFIHLADGESDPTQKTGYLILAEKLYLGDFFVEDQYEDWATSLREEFREMMVNSLIELVEVLYREGRYSESTHYLSKALDIDNLNESAIYLKMLLLQAQNRPLEALKVYDEYVQTLKKEFDFSPSNKLKRLRKSVASRENEVRNVLTLNVDQAKGAQFAEIDLFQKMVRFELKKRKSNAFLVDIRINTDEPLVRWIVEKLLNSISKNLRSGDVCTYQEGHFFILLPEMKEMYLPVILDRLMNISLFKELFGETHVQLQTRSFSIAHERVEPIAFPEKWEPTAAHE
ncbi:MAG TPA: bacterial transcriptional activator domain-containing protein [Thermotogota bacterium]|nr:bacterial transcriptional activator domain-containing protein [Thermotogota bacterium]HRW92569.1 bacterial transcriptional activator domain-containing protein [Thermotogota bacterium]